MRNISGAEIFCMVLAALMFSQILIPVGFAAIGVEEGDWVEYNTESIIEIVDDPLNETGRMKFKVESVSDTTVTLEMTIYQNGTEETETINGTEMGFIIEANLTEGDKVIAPTFDAGVPLSLYINDTVSKEYVGVSREVNYVNYTDIEIQMNGEIMDLNLYEAYWDKATGFLCETSMSASGEIEGETFELSLSVKLTKTNLWKAALPIITILSPENKMYPVEDVPLTFIVSEPISWIGYSLDGQMNVTISGNTTIVGLSDGTHTITVYANDTAGNMGYSDTVCFTIDTVSPNIEILSPENKTYTTSSVPLSFAVDEATSWISYSLDGQANITIAENTTLTGLSDGTHRLVVYASDLAGNIESSDMVYFTIQTISIDITPPNISIVSPENKTYDTTDISLTFTVDESVSWMAYSLDGQANETITGNTTLSGLSDDSHNIIVYAKDTAGNTGASGVIYFTIESQQPEPEPAEPSQLWIVAIIVVITLVGAALLLYFAKFKKTT